MADSAFRIVNATELKTTLDLANEETSTEVSVMATWRDNDEERWRYRQSNINASFAAMGFLFVIGF